MKLLPRILVLSTLVFWFGIQTNAQPQTRSSAGTPPQQNTQARFVSGNTSLQIPFEVSSNLVLMQATVNDSSPVWFVFDTGAESTVIDLTLARSLHLKATGKTVETGGAGTAEAVKFKQVTLRLPNVEIAVPTIYGLPLDSFASPVGRRIDGIIGYDVIKEFVVEIDYVGQKINLYKPDTYQYSGAGEVFPLTFEENMPFVTASIAFEGQPSISGKFEIDSGSTGSVLLNTPFVKKHNLLKSISKTNATRIGGVGGSAQAYLGRVKTFGLGRFTLQNPIARFSQATRGDYASAKYDGLIGGEILRRFKTIYDYSRQRMILEPNEFVTASFERDMSGMDLVADGDDLSILLIDEVRPNSPAAEAGVRGGDVIIAIDDRPTKELTLDHVRRMFMEDGREYALVLKREGKEVRTRIKLQRSI